ncbi:MAG: integrase arm-type DNA-binding domain-containing protein [Fibrobacteres bacterium]|nr:integrase arm-type DNA-binding domain-containing protein [Fibrobacterota bacterium]
MPKLAQPKSDAVYRNAKPRAKPYMIADGHGLSLLVTPEGAKRWVYRYRFGGERKSLTILRGYPTDSVKSARDEVVQLRGMLARGEDPAQVRKGQKQQVTEDALRLQQEQARADATFRKVALEYLARNTNGLTEGSVRSHQQRLEKNIFRSIGARPIADLRPPDILVPLRAVQARNRIETGQRLLILCGQIFRYAVIEGYIESDPTRDLKGSLRTARVRHMAAFTDPKDVAGLLRGIQSYRGGPVVRTAMQFGILTFVRPGNLRMAEWSEFHDLDSPKRAEWRIPPEKMKIRRDHAFIVPLAPQAIKILKELRTLTGSGRYLFPSPRSDKRPLSSNGVLSALRRMGFTSEEMTGHGTRAMVRTIGEEVLHINPLVIEEQLAHQKSGPLPGAYARAQYMPERRKLMVTWADYLDGLNPGSSWLEPEG